VVLKNLEDILFKSIMHFLVEGMKENLQKELVSELFKEDLFGVLLYEDISVKLSREKATQRLAALREAKKVLQKTEISQSK
jgi:dynamin 1-like protein